MTGPVSTSSVPWPLWRPAEYELATSVLFEAFLNFFFHLQTYEGGYGQAPFCEAQGKGNSSIF